MTFQYVNSISNKQKIDVEGDYSSFVINKHFSYFVDTILYANELNIAEVDPQLSYDYYFNAVKKGKRYTKWAKRIDDATITYLQQYYKYSRDKAIQAAGILTSEQIDVIKQRLEKGGV